MKHLNSCWHTASLPAMALMLASCASAGTGPWVEVTPEAAAPGTLLPIMGTVQHLDLEGGVYVIRDAEGRTFHPTNLPAAFRVDGLAVEAVARPREDQMSIGMVGQLVELVRIRKRQDQAPTAAASLRGTAWRLEDLGGTGMMDGAQATLVFSQDGRVSGNASCNRFLGTATIGGSAISFAPLATTRKMCAEAVMQQERRYLEMLSEARRFETRGHLLYIFGAGQVAALRFIRTDEGAGRP